MSVSDLTVATIKALIAPTSCDWVTVAIANLDTILLERSHCERKAATENS